MINGLGEVLIEPVHAFSSVLTRGLVFVSGNAERMTTGVVYRADGAVAFPALGEITIFGGGPDGNSPHIAREAFLYAENGLFGLLSPEGVRLTAAAYDEVRSEYNGAFYWTRRGARFGVAAAVGEVVPPVFDAPPNVLGRGDDAEIAYAVGRVEGVETVYWRGEAVYWPGEDAYVQQLQNTIFVQDEGGLTLVDERFRPVYSFPAGVRFDDGFEGPKGPWSLGGLVPVMLDGLHGAADAQGRMVIPFHAQMIHYDYDTGEYFRAENPYADDRIYIPVAERPPYAAQLTPAKLYDGLPETVFSAGLSPYTLRPGGWAGCVTDAEERVMPEGLEALLGSSFGAER